MFGDPVVDLAAPTDGETTMFGDPVVGAPEQGLMGRINETMEGIPIVGAHFKAGRNLAEAVTNPETWQRGAETIANDIQGGTQGVNPTATQEAVRSGQAIGELIKQPGMKPYISVYDGPQMAPLSDYPADKFTTVMQDGTTYVVPRNATDSAGEGIEEGPLASLGRLFGYGIPNSRPINASMAEAPAAVAPAPRQEAAQAAQDLGITPSLGMTGTAGSKAAAAGEQFAPTAGPIRRDAERVTSEIAGAANRIADKAGPGVTRFDAGTALQEGGETYVQGVRDTQSRLFKAVDNTIAPETTIAAPETVAFLDKEISALEGLPNIAQTLGNGKIAAWREDLASGNLTWQAARKLRSDIGEAVGKISGPNSDMAQGRLKAIYGRLSDDIRAAAEAAGPDAANAWNRAQTYTRVSEDRIRTAFGKILKADTPERAYSILTGYAAEGASGSNITALKRVMQSLPEDDRAVVAGTIVRRLGRASAGAQDAAGEAFSPATFLTNWNKMSPEARATIARNGLDDGVADELTKLAKVAERYKESGADRNHSNTAGAMSQIALASGVIGALFGGGSPMAAAGIVAGAAGANVSARFLTNPRVLHALNRAAATGELTALKRIAEGQGVTPEIAMEAATILRLQAPEAPSSPQSQPTGLLPTGG